MAALIAMATADRPVAPARPRIPIVEDIVKRRDAALCALSSTLMDAADTLILHERTALGIVNEQGLLLGVITENDILRVFSTGVPSQTGVGTWLESGYARFAKAAVSALTVLVTSGINEAAAQMRKQIATDSACHHLVVNDEQGFFCGILSALDLARAMCTPEGSQTFARSFGGLTATEIMKPIASLPKCSSGFTMGQVLTHMLASQQNLVLIVEDGRSSPIPESRAEQMEDGPAIVGVVTPRDALRAFAEHTRPHVDAAHWLRGLRARLEVREVPADTNLMEVARVMSEGALHHLVVTSSDDGCIVGVVSALDLAQAIACA